ncbi:MAG: transglycosylase SLT domain-containing protein [Gammaproteobacteria bacterium]|nr:transglycosylase SLT domain-containing protein [Gammaproteobacteria bacterium]
MRYVLILIVVFAGSLQSSLAYQPNLELQRQQFLHARLFLQQGNEVAFQDIKKQLQGYPLARFLQFEWLQRQIEQKSVKSRQIQHFFKRYPKTALSRRLRQSWLMDLAARSQWKTFLQVAAGHSKELSNELACARLQALHDLGHLRGVVGEARKLWMSAKTHQGRCASVFAQLEQQRPPASPLVWQKISVAMRRSKPALAASLRHFLKPSARLWLDVWIAVHHQPKLIFSNRRLQKDSLLSRKIVLHGVKQLARQNLVEMHKKWPAVKNRYKFRSDQVNRMARYLAMRAAYLGMPEAYGFLKGLKGKQHNGQTRSWLVRTALRQQDWPAVLKSIRRLSKAERDEKEWRYWQARALELTGKKKAAEKIYRRLARRAHYYGFMAADRLQAEYRFYHKAIAARKKVQQALLLREDMRRVQEYRAVNLWPEARHEWNVALKKLNHEQLKAAALLADRWQWHDRALFTAAKSKQFNDLELRYPMPYKTAVFAAAANEGLPPSLVYGVIRQESAYMPKVKSHVGAVGLMQLMPATAQTVATVLGSASFKVVDLKTVATNLKFGTHYYRQVLDQFAGNQAMASAAYNAGPHRVEGWLPGQRAMPADVWVDTIPFTETRGYVKSVLGNATIFEWRMKGETMRISERMKQVPSRSALSL